MVKKCFLSVWLFLCFTLFSGASFADACGNFAKKNGFGFIDTSSLICKTERYDGQTCRRSKFSDSSNFLYTSRCKLDGNYVWSLNPADFDYSIKAGMFTTFKVKIKNNDCFAAKLYNERQLTDIYFCEFGRSRSFNSDELKKLFKDIKKTGPRVNKLTSWSNENNNEPSSNSSSSENSPSGDGQSLDMQKAVTECTNLGFTKGTEKHGECVLKLLSLNTSNLNLSGFTEFRKLLFMVDEETHHTFAAFRQNKGRANGIFFFESRVCNWTSQIIDSSKRLGKFDANCPSGLEVNGQFNYQDAKSGSSGIGTDNRGRRVSYILQGQGSSSKSEVQNYFSKSL